MYPQLVSATGVGMAFNNAVVFCGVVAESAEEGLCGFAVGLYAV